MDVSKVVSCFLKILFYTRNGLALESAQLSKTHLSLNVLVALKICLLKHHGGRRAFCCFGRAGTLAEGYCSKFAKIGVFDLF